MAVLSIVFGISKGYAQLEEHEVLLVYNSLHAESNEIAQYYMQARPGVIPFDLQIEYVSGSPAEPNTLAANNRYITPQAFLDWIRTPILDFIDNDARGEHILAMATTRGVPSLVSTDFSIGPGHAPGQPVGDALPSVRGGVESLLARLGIGESWENLPVSELGTPNPYYRRLNVPFRDFIAEEHAGDFCHANAGGPEYAGKLFLVTRLDSDRPNAGPEGLIDGTFVDGVKALIDRSLSLVVNKFETTLVLDNGPDGTGCGSNGSYLRRDRDGLQYMYQAGWCTYYDESANFIYGADSPYADPMLEHLAYPELLHVSMGRNHSTFSCGGAPVDRCYVSGLRPHPAGLFISVESYNGHSIRTPGHQPVPPAPSSCGNPPGQQCPCGEPGSGAPHGQALRWIARGGSFASGSVVGAGSGQILHADYVLANLYEHNLSWAEAVYSSLAHVGHYQTPIGDPLATVVVHDPDVNGDGIWDESDMHLIEQLQGSRGPFGDVNGDGLVDGADLAIVSGFNDRDCSTDPMAAAGDWPMASASGTNWHGDANRDRVVNRSDLDYVVDRFGQYCAMDATGTGIVDEYDVLSVLCNWGRVTGDVDRDCAVGVSDQIAVTASWGECSWPCMADIAGDSAQHHGPNGVVGVQDLNMVILNWNSSGHPACHQPPEVEDIASIPIGYISPSWLTTENQLDPDACELLDHWFGNPAYE